ncbi:hypothetical protein EAJ11_12815 [Bacteroides uniformis]|nr:hypothetical protein EAJ11_12815 [Bacteroides uniformis]
MLFLTDLLMSTEILSLNIDLVICQYEKIENNVWQIKSRGDSAIVTVFKIPQIQKCLSIVVTSIFLFALDVSYS